MRTFREPLGKFGIDARLNINPLGRNTSLSRIAELALDRPIDRGVDVGILKKL